MRDAFTYGWRLSELRGDQATAAMGAVLGHGQREDVELGRIELLHVRLILPYVTGPPAVGTPDPVPRRHIRSVLRRAGRLVDLRLIGCALVAHLDLQYLSPARQFLPSSKWKPMCEKPMSKLQSGTRPVTSPDGLRAPWGFAYRGTDRRRGASGHGPCG